MNSFLILLIIVIICYMIVRKSQNHDSTPPTQYPNDDLTKRATAIVELKDLIRQTAEFENKCELYLHSEYYGRVDPDYLRQYRACIELCEEKLNYLKRISPSDADLSSYESSVSEIRKRYSRYSN